VWKENEKMKKVFKKAMGLLLKPFALLFTPLFRFLGWCGMAVCNCFGHSSDVKRAAAAGAILFGIAGAAMGARNEFDYTKPTAGVIVTIAWGYKWLFTALLGVGSGAVVGAAAAYLARLKNPQTGAAAAVLVVGALGGALAGGTWARAIARDRVFQVQAQPAHYKPMVVQDATRVDAVSGGVRLTGAVSRPLNMTLLSFMLAGGALVGTFAARGLKSDNYRADASAPEAAPQPRPRRN
jgi:hypothetical protein